MLVGSATLIATGGGLVVHVSELVALLGEVDTLVPIGRVVAEAHGVVAGGGVRFRGRRWALDAGAFTALDRKGVLPFVVGTYRFLPD